MAGRIKALRKELRYSLAEVGRWFDVPRQAAHQAENTDRTGQKIDDLRARILTRLLEEAKGKGASVEGPFFVVTMPADPTLFDKQEKQAA